MNAFGVNNFGVSFENWVPPKMGNVAMNITYNNAHYARQ
jgi:hypothetical protein